MSVKAQSVEEQKELRQTSAKFWGCGLKDLLMYHGACEEQADCNVRRAIEEGKTCLEQLLKICDSTYWNLCVFEGWIDEQGNVQTDYSKIVATHTTEYARKDIYAIAANDDVWKFTISHERQYLDAKIKHKSVQQNKQ